MFSSRVGPSGLGGMPGPLLTALLGAVLLLSLMCSGCSDQAPPEASPSPSPAPTDTPLPQNVLDGLLFAITLNGRLLATEELETRVVDGSLYVSSTLHWAESDGMVERRSVALSPLLYPTNYTLERSLRGVTSWSVAQRDGGSLSLLSNNRQWYGPVWHARLEPVPGLLMEQTPSALPLALLVLQYTAGRSAADYGAPFRLPVLDVTDDLPASHDLTLSLTDEQGEAVIGTLALEGAIAREGGHSFTLWLRPDSRLLFRAEFPDYRPGFWEALRYPALNEPGLLRIERVSELPAVPDEEPDGGPELITLQGSTGELRARLYRPSGEAPAPVLLVRRGWRQPDLAESAEAWRQQGWAVCVLDPSGVGDSPGEFRAESELAEADDLVQAARQLASVAGLDCDAIVLVGVGESAAVVARAVGEASGAAASGSGAPIAGAVLASGVFDGAAIPQLAADQALALADHYGWGPDELSGFLALSVHQWQAWLAKEEIDFSRLGRRVSLSGLAAWAALDLSAVLRSISVPLLVLHGSRDEWTPPAGAERLVQRLMDAGAPVTYIELEGLGHDLGRTRGTLWAAEADSALEDWLGGLP